MDGVSRVAVIGSGISGLAAAYFASRRHEVSVFERDGRLGGHTNTVVIDGPRGPVPLDTGFLVHNHRTYPGLVRLFGELGVATRDSDMSFAVTCPKTGLEYSSRGAPGFFAQRRNLLAPAHYRLLAEIVRFNREAPAVLNAPDAASLSLGDFLRERRFAEPFIYRYLYPMASAIWSASLEAIGSFPAVTFVRFLDNHGLLGLTSQPRWKVVSGGSHTYIPGLAAPLGGRIVRGAAITAVRRSEQAVTIAFADRPSVTFDEVVFACGGDQVLPRRAAARASWNYLLAGDRDEAPVVTYDLNRLQGIGGAERYCVTLNPRTPIDERRVLKRLVYRHPLYTAASIRAQSRWAEISGARRTHFCGAYWGFGFHEDGLSSAVRVATSLGVRW